MKQEKEIKKELKRLNKLLSRAVKVKAHPMILMQITAGIACLSWTLGDKKDPWLLLK